MGFLENIDVASLGEISFGALIVIGTVNVVDILFKKFMHRSLESHEKVFVSLVAGFAVTFVPTDVQNDLLARFIVAAQYTLGSSGGYKLFQLLGSRK